MGYKHNKAEYKEKTTICLYPSTKRKAERLKLNISKFVEAAIAAMPDPEEEKEGGAIGE